MLVSLWCRRTNSVVFLLYHTPLSQFYCRKPISYPVGFQAFLWELYFRSANGALHYVLLIVSLKQGFGRTTFCTLVGFVMYDHFCSNSVKFALNKWVLWSCTPILSEQGTSMCSVCLLKFLGFRSEFSVVFVFRSFTKKSNLKKVL